MVEDACEFGKDDRLLLLPLELLLLRDGFILGRARFVRYCCATDVWKKPDQIL